VARPYRLQSEDCFYHITSRGNNRNSIFSKETDYRKFLDYLTKAKKKYKFYLYAYMLMGNHYHLLVETIEPNLSRIMQYINTAYTVYFNRKYKKNGHLFQGRYKSIVVDKDNYLLELTRYIHLNPVRAKIVERPEGYLWSSYHGYMKKKGDGVIDRKEVNKYLDMDIDKYREFVLDGIGKESDVFKNIYAGFILGSTRFIKDKLRDLREKVESREFSYRRELNNQVSANEIVEVVAGRYEKEVEELYKARKKQLEAKKVAIYILKRNTAMTNEEIGKMFGISYSAVSKADKDVERLKEKNQKMGKEIEGIISHFKV